MEESDIFIIYLTFMIMSYIYSLHFNIYMNIFYNFINDRIELLLLYFEKIFFSFEIFNIIHTLIMPNFLSYFFYVNFLISLEWHYFYNITI